MGALTHTGKARTRALVYVRAFSLRAFPSTTPGIVVVALSIRPLTLRVSRYESGRVGGGNRGVRRRFLDWVLEADARCS